MTLMPVSKISSVGFRRQSREPGGGSASARHSRAGAPSIDVAQHVEDATERRLADGHGDRDGRCRGPRPTGEAVGRVECDRAHLVVAQVLLHLGDKDGSILARDLQRVVDGGQVAAVEADVDHDALDREDGSRVAVVSHAWFALLVWSAATERASAPATTSRISWVMAAWRARFIFQGCNRRSAMRGIVGSRCASRCAVQRVSAAALLEQGTVDRDIDVRRQHPAPQDILRAWLKQRQRGAPPGPHAGVRCEVPCRSTTWALDRQQLLDDHLLLHDRLEGVVDQQDPVDLLGDEQLPPGGSAIPSASW